MSTKPGAVPGSPLRDGLVKWITGRATDRDGFDRGQRGWAELRGVPGFRGQCGGWSRREPGRAHVFAFWADEPGHRRFLAGVHDRIAAGQAGTYRDLEVRLFEQRLIIQSLIIQSLIIQSLISQSLISQSLGVQSPGVESPGVESPGVQSPGVESPGVESPGVESPGVQSPGVQSPGVQSPGVRQPGVQRPGVQRPGVQRLGSGAGIGGALVRLAHCRVRPGRQQHFARAQAEVWNPGMAAAPGMLGGTFAQRGDAEFLVLTRWRSVADHERYVERDFPALRHRSGAADDLEAVTGDLIDLNPAWSVCG